MFWKVTEMENLLKNVTPKNWSTKNFCQKIYFSSIFVAKTGSFVSSGQVILNHGIRGYNLIIRKCWNTWSYFLFSSFLSCFVIFFWLWLKSSSTRNLQGEDWWGIKLVSCIKIEKLYILKVTADIHAIQATSMQVFISVFSLGGLLRSLVGPMPFWVTFGWIQMNIWSQGFCLAVNNVSSFMQMALIVDFR